MRIWDQWPQLFRGAHQALLELQRPSDLVVRHRLIMRAGPSSAVRSMEASSAVGIDEPVNFRNCEDNTRVQSDGRVRVVAAVIADHISGWNMSNDRGASDRTVDALLNDVLQFRDARDWAQFHAPRNLAAALSIEAAELQETMLWQTDGEVARSLEDPALRQRIAHEIADVMVYALLLAHSVGVDIPTAIREKLALNEAKYPVDRAKGSARKYTDI